jgi:integrase
MFLVCPNDCCVPNALLQVLSGNLFERRTMKPVTDFSKLTLQDAAVEWLQERELSKRASTIECYRDYIARLLSSPLFAGKTLEEIAANPWTLLAYQRERKDRYHPTSVNHDCNTLLQILGRAGLRSQVEEHYHPLAIPDWQPPKVLSEAEEDRFFVLAASRKDWEMAYWVASLTNNTSASGKELRLLQLRHIHLEDDPPNFEVPRNQKNPYRMRRIPLNDTGRKQMERLLLRAHELHSCQPDHYLFPFRERDTKRYNPEKPASPYWIYYQWGKLVDAAVSTCICGHRRQEHAHAPGAAIPPREAHTPPQNAQERRRLGDPGVGDSGNSTPAREARTPPQNAQQRRMFGDPGSGRCNSCGERVCRQFKPSISFRPKPHNLRHQIITRMLEDGHPEETVREICGHVRREMMLHYSHARLEKKNQVLRAIDRKEPQRCPEEDKRNRARGQPCG